MKFIDSSVRYIAQEAGIEGMYKMIEDAARICYKSSNNGKITSKEFVDGLIKKDHARPLEFGSVYMKVPTDKLPVKCASLFVNQWSKIASLGNYTYITTNYRVIVENKLQDFMEEYWSDKLDYHFDRPCFIFDCSRVTGDSFRTHITLSSLMESTRYCSYDKDKFGNEITIVTPEWYKKCEDIETKNLFVMALEQSERNYMQLLKLGLSSQLARGVLPFDVKATLAMCGFKEAWENFLYRRRDSAAHPDAQKLSNELGNLLKNL